MPHREHAEVPAGVDVGTCRGCGKPIWWISLLRPATAAEKKESPGKEQTEVKLPLNPQRTRLYVPNDTPGGRPWVTLETRGYISHFKTCPKASRFSGKGRR